MDILWGAWVERVRLDERQQLVDITGIFDSISKEGKKDFPFTVDLQAIIACQSKLSESSQTFQMTLNIIDEIGQSIYLNHEQIIVPEAVDTLIRWYESYIFSNIEIREPGYYQLSILINGEEKQLIPLRVFGHKITIIDYEKDSTTEMWREDWDSSN